MPKSGWESMSVTLHRAKHTGYCLRFSDMLETVFSQNGWPTCATNLGKCVHTFRSVRTLFDPARVQPESE